MGLFSGFINVVNPPLDDGIEEVDVNSQGTYLCAANQVDSSDLAPTVVDSGAKELNPSDLTAFNYLGNWTYNADWELTEHTSDEEAENVEFLGLFNPSSNISAMTNLNTVEETMDYSAAYVAPNTWWQEDLQKRNDDGTYIFVENGDFFVGIPSYYGAAYLNNFLSIPAEFASDFEDIYKVDPNQFNLDIKHYINYGTGPGGGALMDITTEQAASGTKSVKVEVMDTLLSRRCQLEFKNVQELSPDGFFARVKLFLPTEFDLTPTENTNWNYYEFFDWVETVPDNFANTSYWCLSLDQNFSNGMFTLNLRGRGKDTNNEQFTLDSVPNFPLKKGEWFTVEVYVKRHESNGKIQVWIDGVKYFDITGVRTMYVPEYRLQPMKCYFNEVDRTHRWHYADDFELYKTDQF